MWSWGIARGLRRPYPRYGGGAQEGGRPSEGEDEGDGEIEVESDGKGEGGGGGSGSGGGYGGSECEGEGESERSGHLPEKAVENKEIARLLFVD